MSQRDEQEREPLLQSTVPPSAEALAEDRRRARDELRSFFMPLFAGTGGIDSWLQESTRDEVFDRLYNINAQPLSRAQLNQLLVLSNEAGISPGFFRYYWLTAPEHPYDVREAPGFSGQWVTSHVIRSLGHLKWGFYRFYIDALLFFGSIRSAYRYLRDMEEGELKRFFAGKRYKTEALVERGLALPLREIAKDDRYLISEMACKSFVGVEEEGADLKVALDRAYAAYRRERGRRVTFRDLLEGTYAYEEFSDRQQQLVFSAADLLDLEITGPDDLEAKYQRVLTSFNRAREAALANTGLYLSMAEELDVYVATSMRTRQDFRDMADFCEFVFSQGGLQQLNIRYFDPTLSAAEGHEDKGLIECLMVKVAKILVYSAGSRESFGKDAEAAMALSLGKPVIFYCDDEQRQRFYRDIHPLSRLIDFQSGIAVGAMVTSDMSTVAELITRILENRMAYILEQPKKGYLRLLEERTKSVVRLQTSDPLLRETFWNYYHRDGARNSLGPGVGASHDER